MADEKDLYAPVKAYLEGQGYQVKSEIGACDVVARRGDEAPVVVELKSRFNLELVLQAVERQTVAETIYVAIPDDAGGAWKRHRRRILKLCRMLGVGLLLVRPGAAKGRQVTAQLDPGPYRPRANPKKRGRLLKEFSERVGDPNTGGVTRTRIVTAYRQDALRLLAVIDSDGALSPKDLRLRTGVEKAGPILQDNHYGWFERVSRGVYGLTPKGHDALKAYALEIGALSNCG